MIDFKDRAEFVGEVSHPRRLRLLNAAIDGVDRSEIGEGEDREYLEDVNQQSISVHLGWLQSHSLLIEVEDDYWEVSDEAEDFVRQVLEAVTASDAFVKRQFLAPLLGQIPNWPDILCDIDILAKCGEVVEVENEGGNDVDSKSNVAQQAYSKRVREADSVREVIHRGIVADLFLLQLRADELEAEIITSKDHFDAARESPTRLDRWKKMVEAGAEYYSVDQKFPFTLTLFDDEGVGIYPSGWTERDVFYYSEHPEVRSWAEDFIDDVFDNAESEYPEE